MNATWLTLSRPIGVSSKEALVLLDLLYSWSETTKVFVFFIRLRRVAVVMVSDIDSVFSC